MCMQSKRQDDSGVLPPADALEALVSSSLDCRASCPHASCHLDALAALTTKSGTTALERFERLLGTVADEEPTLQ